MCVCRTLGVELKTAQGNSQLASHTGGSLEARPLILRCPQELCSAPTD